MSYVPENLVECEECKSGMEIPRFGEWVCDDCLENRDYWQEEEAFDKWFTKLKELIGNLDKRYHAYFDLSQTNHSCWREAFDNGQSPEDCLRKNLEALTN